MTKSSGFAFRITFWAILTFLSIIVASTADAQRPRFPDFFQAQPATPGSVAAPPTFVSPPSFSTQGAIAPGTTIAPQSNAPFPVFDPFQSTGVQPLPFSNSQVPANTVPSIQFPPNQTQSFQASPFFDQPALQPFELQQPQFFGSPNSQEFPRAAQTGSFLTRFRDDYLPRLLERPRFRHTYLPGNNGNELQIHDIEFATTLTFPRFLFTEEPVRITPGFIGHFWDGPETLGPFGTGFDVPETAFSAFLTMEHYSNPDLRAGVESNFTVGVYSDYNHLDSDSLRITGVGLGWVRVNETNIFKFGVEYFDRLELKLLPAFGLFIRPTNDLQLDLYFPRPRIAQRMPTYRALESWLYIGGEYGGGNWTVERDFGDDRIDINDYRAVLGLEWYNQRGVTGFFEIGYVFDRELVSQAAFPSRKLKLQDTIILRSGLEF